MVNRTSAGIAVAVVRHLVLAELLTDEQSVTALPSIEAVIAEGLKWHAEPTTRVLRLIEYVGTADWIATTLASQGALIPSGTGTWGGRITSAVVPNELLEQAAAQPSSTRPSTVSFDQRDTIERQAAEIARMRAMLEDLISAEAGGDPMNWVVDAKKALGETA